MNGPGVVIVGAGQGGFQAAVSLRQEGYVGDIKLIGAEPGVPYQRPPLSKNYLKSGKAEALSLRPESFYEQNKIELVPETFVKKIERAARKVITPKGTFAYDHLILATGTRNLRPPIAGLDRALDLRTLADAARLREALSCPRRCAVIGGGFIGLEFAAVARHLGHEVTVAEASSRLMARVVSPEMSARFHAKHEEMGTKICTGSPVAEVTDTGVRLADGTEISADLVLLAAGVVPNAELADAAGLSVENGVIVNSWLCTDDSHISALGDCAVFPDPRTGRSVRLESVQAATDHARLIAKRITGKHKEPYTALPWFWSDQADWKLQIAGLASPNDSSVVASDGSVLRFSAGQLTAVETVNNAKIHMKARRLLSTPDDLSKAEVIEKLFEEKILN